MWLDQSAGAYCSGRSHLLTTDRWLCCWYWKKSHCFGLEPFKHPADVFKEIFSIHSQTIREKCPILMWNIPSGALLQKHLSSKTSVNLKLHWTKTPQTFWVPGELSSFFSSLWKGFGKELVSVVTGSIFHPAIVSKTHLFSLPLKWMHNLGGCGKIIVGKNKDLGLRHWTKSTFRRYFLLKSNKNSAKMLRISGGWNDLELPWTLNRDSCVCLFSCRSHQMRGTPEVPV